MSNSRKDEKDYKRKSESDYDPKSSSSKRSRHPMNDDKSHAKERKRESQLAKYKEKFDLKKRVNEDNIRNGKPTNIFEYFLTVNKTLNKDNELKEFLRACVDKYDANSASHAVHIVFRVIDPSDETILPLCYKDPHFLAKLQNLLRWYFKNEVLNIEKADYKQYLDLKLLSMALHRIAALIDSFEAPQAMLEQIDTKLIQEIIQHLLKNIARLDDFIILNLLKLAGNFFSADVRPNAKKIDLKVFPAIGIDPTALAKMFNALKGLIKRMPELTPDIQSSLSFRLGKIFMGLGGFIIENDHNYVEPLDASTCIELIKLTAKLLQEEELEPKQRKRIADNALDFVAKIILYKNEEVLFDPNDIKCLNNILSVDEEYIGTGFYAIRCISEKNPALFKDNYIALFEELINHMVNMDIKNPVCFDRVFLQFERLWRTPVALESFDTLDDTQLDRLTTNIAKLTKKLAHYQALSAISIHTFFIGLSIMMGKWPFLLDQIDSKDINTILLLLKNSLQGVTSYNQLSEEQGRTITYAEALIPTINFIGNASQTNKRLMQATQITDLKYLVKEQLKEINKTDEAESIKSFFVALNNITKSVKIKIHPEAIASLLTKLNTLPTAKNITLIDSLKAIVAFVERHPSMINSIKKELVTLFNRIDHNDISINQQTIILHNIVSISKLSPDLNQAFEPVLNTITLSFKKRGPINHVGMEMLNKAVISLASNHIIAWESNNSELIKFTIEHGKLAAIKFFKTADNKSYDTKIYRVIFLKRILSFMQLKIVPPEAVVQDIYAVIDRLLQVKKQITKEALQDVINVLRELAKTDIKDFNKNSLIPYLFQLRQRAESLSKIEQAVLESDLQALEVSLLSQPKELDKAINRIEDSDMPPVSEDHDKELDLASDTAHNAIHQENEMDIDELLYSPVTSESESEDLQTDNIAAPHIPGEEITKEDAEELTEATTFKLFGTVISFDPKTNSIETQSQTEIPPVVEEAMTLENNIATEPAQCLDINDSAPASIAIEVEQSAQLESVAASTVTHEMAIPVEVENTERLQKVAIDIPVLNTKFPPAKQYDIHSDRDLDQLEKDTNHSFIYDRKTNKYDKKTNKLGTRAKLYIAPVAILGNQLGVFAGEDIKKGQRPLGKYAGKEIAVEDEDAESDYKFPVYDHEKSDSEPILIIDAKDIGDWSRFVNHGCTPNVRTAFKAIVDEDGKTRYVIEFYPLRDIKKGEQLIFDYGVESYFKDIGYKPFFMTPKYNSDSLEKIYSENKDAYSKQVYRFNADFSKTLGVDADVYWLVPKAVEAIHENNDYELTFWTQEDPTIGDLPLIAFTKDGICPPAKQPFLTTFNFACLTGNASAIKEFIKHLGNRHYSREYPDMKLVLDRPTLLLGQYPIISLLMSNLPNDEVIPLMKDLLRINYVKFPHNLTADRLSALHFCIKRNSPELVKMFLDIFALNDPISPFLFDRSPDLPEHYSFDYCLKHGQLEILEILIDYALNQPNLMNGEFYQLINEEKLLTKAMMKEVPEEHLRAFILLIENKADYKDTLLQGLVLDHAKAALNSIVTAKSIAKLCVPLPLPKPIPEFKPKTIITPHTLFGINNNNVVEQAQHNRSQASADFREKINKLAKKLPNKFMVYDILREIGRTHRKLNDNDGGLQIPDPSNKSAFIAAQYYQYAHQCIEKELRNADFTVFEVKNNKINLQLERITNELDHINKDIRQAVVIDDTLTDFNAIIDQYIKEVETTYPEQAKAFYSQILARYQPANIQLSRNNPM